MNISNWIDIEINDEGDWELDDSGDFSLVVGTDVLRDDVHIRVMTEAPGWSFAPNMGANLEDLIGEPNTRKTGERGRRSIISSLTWDSRIPAQDLDVIMVPVENGIEYHIFIETNQGEEKLKYSLDLNDGLRTND